MSVRRYPRFVRRTGFPAALRSLCALLGGLGLGALGACAQADKMSRMSETPRNEVKETKRAPANTPVNTPVNTPKNGGRDAGNAIAQTPARPEVQPATVLPAPCDAPLTEVCGPFAPELVQLCARFSGGDASACRNPKWSKAFHQSLMNHARGHLSNGSAAAAWTSAECASLFLVKGQTLALRSEPDIGKSAVIEGLAAAPQLRLIPIETWGDWRKVRVAAEAPAAAAGKVGWLLGIGLTCETAK